MAAVPLYWSEEASSSSLNPMHAPLPLQPASHCSWLSAPQQWTAWGAPTLTSVTASTAHMDWIWALWSCQMGTIAQLLLWAGIISIFLFIDILIFHFSVSPLLGYSAEEMIGRSWYSLVHPEDLSLSADSHRSLSKWTTAFKTKRQLNVRISVFTGTLNTCCHLFTAHWAL